MKTCYKTLGAFSCLYEIRALLPIPGEDERGRGGDYSWGRGGGV